MTAGPVADTPLMLVPLVTAVDNGAVRFNRAKDLLNPPSV